jgi:hypothetical protein
MFFIFYRVLRFSPVSIISPVIAPYLPSSWYSFYQRICGQRQYRWAVNRKVLPRLFKGCKGFTIAVPNLMETRSVYLEIRPVSRHHLPSIRRFMSFMSTTMSHVLSMSEDFREVPKIAVFLNTFPARRIDGVEMLRKSQLHIPTVCGWMSQCL